MLLGMMFAFLDELTCMCGKVCKSGEVPDILATENFPDLTADLYISFGTAIKIRFCPSAVVTVMGLPALSMVGEEEAIGRGACLAATLDVITTAAESSSAAAVLWNQWRPAVSAGLQINKKQNWMYFRMYGCLHPTKYFYTI